MNMSCSSVVVLGNTFPEPVLLPSPGLSTAGVLSDSGGGRQRGGRDLGIKET